MKYSYAVALGIALLAPITDSLEIHKIPKRDSDEPRVLGLPIWKWPSSDPVNSDASRMKRREAKTLETVLDNYVSYFTQTRALRRPTNLISGTHVCHGGGAWDTTTEVQDADRYWQ